MNGPLKSLSEQLGQPKVDQVPNWIVQKAISLRTSLSEMVDNANAVLKNPSQPILHTNMKDYWPRLSATQKRLKPMDERCRRERAAKA